MRHRARLLSSQPVAVERESGKVDGLVNCAGSAANAGVFDMTNEQWAFTIATDMTSAFHVTRAVAAEPAKYNITCNAI